MTTSDGIVGLAEGIIDDTILVITHFTKPIIFQFLLQVFEAV